MSEEANVNLAESDSVAILRNGNAVTSLPVYLDPNNTPFIKLDGVWRAIIQVQNFRAIRKTAQEETL